MSNEVKTMSEFEKAVEAAEKLEPSRRSAVLKQLQNKACDRIGLGCQNSPPLAPDCDRFSEEKKARVKRFIANLVQAEKDYLLAAELKVD